jgi:hypothetical protein
MKIKNIMTHLRRIKKESRAFTLFVSLIVASLLLAIGFSIGNILIKQLILTQNGSGTQIAFYAADSASECALFWDRKDAEGFTLADSPFGTSSVETTPGGTGITLVCGTGGPTGGGIVYGFTKVCDDGLCGAGAVAATSSFYIDYKDPKDVKYLACAYVKVYKKFDIANGTEETTIDARGYNTDLVVDTSGGGYGYPADSTQTARCNLERPRTVERGLYLTY